MATIDTRAALRGDEDSQAREIEAEAETYEAGRDELEAQVPEGWLMLSIGVPERADTYQPRRR
ncbi:hypothetical protein [Promicromonospora sp. NPDC090134]|uniref:hypothetical protein n=1 Tax=Promicromonospora sp. NPDC090134 TaxID=3364408 RepID=UPI003816FD52